jgi:hypothetical protein
LKWSLMVKRSIMPYIRNSKIAILRARKIISG